VDSGQTQANNQQAQTVPGVQVDFSQIKGSTKFDDMTPQAQGLISQVDEVLQKVFTWRNEIMAYTPQHEKEIRQLSRDVAYLEKKYELVRRAVLEGDVAAVQEVRTLSNENTKDFQSVRLSVDNLKLPAQYHLPGLWSTSGGAKTSFGGDPDQTDLIDFFNRHVAHLDERNRKVRAYLDEIQQHMPNVENGLYQKLTMLQSVYGSSSVKSNQLEDIKTTLVDMRGAIVAQAVQVGKLREKMTQLQIQLYNPL
jgi:nucleoporin p58/p45